MKNAIGLKGVIGGIGNSGGLIERSYMVFGAVELAIARQMQTKSGWRTTNEIAEQVQVAWETADKALKSLYEKGYLVMGIRRQRTYWRLY